MIGLVTMGAVALGACSGGSARSTAAPARGASTADQAGGASTPSHPAIDLTRAKKPGDGRQLEKTADVAIEAKDVRATERRATAVVAAAGGYLYSEAANGAAAPAAHIVFKVPPEHFDRVTAQLATLGRVLHSSVTTDDATNRVVDLDARLAAARTGADRLRELLAKSGNVTDLLQVEQALSQREADVESLAGQAAALRAQVDLATVSLDLSSAPASGRGAAPSHDIPGFVAGLRTGAAAFANTAQVVATGLGFALPFLAVALLAGVPVWRISRRRRRHAAIPAAE